jgi:hypothetical protein
VGGQKICAGHENFQAEQHKVQPAKTTTAPQAPSEVDPKKSRDSADN